VKTQRAVVVLLLIVGLFLSAFGEARAIGFFVHIENNTALVQGGSDPKLLVWAAVSVPLFIFLVTRQASFEIIGIPSWTRRFAAFLIDFCFALLAIAPWVAIIPLGAEALRTGNFVWSSNASTRYRRIRTSLSR
jgi:hypothetical protein